MPDDDLERMLTQSLRTMSEDADPTTTGDLAERARGTTRTRRRKRRGVAVAVAAVIVAPIVYVAVQNPTDNSRGTNAPAVSGVPSDWRVESYGDVELRVPPSWGWGGVPTVDHDNLLFCGTGAFAVPSGKPDPDGVEGVPYVGRAGFGMTDLCQLERDVTGTSPFVWFDSPLEPGSSTVTGIPVETIEVAGTRVSVGDQDADRQAQILSTVEQIRGQDGNGCQPQRPESPAAGLPDVKSVSAVKLCVYHADGEASDELLSFSTRVEGSPAEQIYAAIRDTPTSGEDCVFRKGALRRRHDGVPDGRRTSPRDSVPGARMYGIRQPSPSHTRECRAVGHGWCGVVHLGRAARPVDRAVLPPCPWVTRRRQGNDGDAASRATPMAATAMVA